MKGKVAKWYRDPQRKNICQRADSFLKIRYLDQIKEQANVVSYQEVSWTEMVRDYFIDISLALEYKQEIL